MLREGSKKIANGTILDGRDTWNLKTECEAN